METLAYPIATEKAIRMIEGANIITFIVDKKASKTKIKKAFEDMFKVKVEKINIMIDTVGTKKAMITIKKEFNALDVATQLGLM